jgi:antibiotic biosynthesis monooxygenase (ABM) superfamily enzyme
MAGRIARIASISLAAVVIFFAGWAAGRETFQTQKTAIHCAGWTAKEGLTQAEFDTFKAKLSALPGMFPGLRRIWVGKLGEEVTYDNQKRDHGIALEFDSYDAKLAYSKSPRRAEWLAMFESVRKPGSTNFDLIGE